MKLKRGKLSPVKYNYCCYDAEGNINSNEGYKSFNDKIKHLNFSCVVSQEPDNQRKQIGNRSK